MQVYRYMDIGTAKPSDDELKMIPHHLINMLSPDETFSAGLFKEKATEIIKKLHAHHKVPVIAGGTGLYIRSLTGGLFDGPGADEPVRAALREQEKRKGKGYLYTLLKRIDPEAAGKIASNDLRRLIRALEVSLKEQKEISKIRKISTHPVHHDFIKIGLFRERAELYRIIEERVDRMMEKGLLEETKRLMEMNPGRTALQALGYKEMILFLEGHIDLNEAVRLTKKRTKMYAKRQYTWFRKEPGIHWIDISGITDVEKIFAKVMNDIEILKKLIYSNEY